jgi:hypothetical protein
MNDFTQTAISTVQSSLGDVLYNLSYILTDSNGLISDSDARYILNNLQVSSTGMIQSDIPSPIHAGDVQLSQDIFNPITSNRCADKFSLLSLSDSLVVYRTEYPVDKPSSPILDASRNLPSTAESMICYLYMEMYSLYTALVEFRQGDVFSVTDVELSTIMSNTRAVSTALGNVGDDSVVYPLLDILRYIQRAILLVKYNMSTILR